MTNPAIEIRCLGDFAVHGLAADLRGAKQIALLGYLAANLGKACPRQTLISIFWADRFDDQARQSLRQSLSALRRAFSSCPGGLNIERDSVHLNPDWVSVDIKQAEAAAANDDLAIAAGIFRRGDFLAGLTPKDSAIADWLMMERAKWREIARHTVTDHGGTLLRQGQLDDADQAATWLVRQDPLDEAATRLAMRAKAALGAPAEAAKLYLQLTRNLQTELGVKPATETTNCFNQLHDGTDTKRGVPSNAGIASSIMSQEPSDVPLISVEAFEFAPDTSANQALAADLHTQLIFRLTKRMGIKVFEETDGLTDTSTYVLRGRLRVSGDQGRLNLSMVLRAQSRTVFSQNYAGDTSDTFKFCDDLIAQAETHLRVQTNAFDGERLSQIPDEQLTVPQLRSRAANLLHTGTVDGFHHAARLMDQAIWLDANDPASLAMRANIKIWLSMAGCGALTDTQQDKLGADLNTALERQHNSDYIYHVRGTFFACCKRDALATLRDGERCREINPNYALAFNTLGLGHLLLGQYEQAVEALESYVALSDNDPLLPARLFPLAVAQYCNGQYASSVTTVDRAIVLKPNHRLLHRLKAMGLRVDGETDNANAADVQADLLPVAPSVIAVCPPLPEERSAHFAKLLI